jgi:hypothetical protein
LFYPKLKTGMNFMLYLYKRRGTDEHNLLKPTFGRAALNRGVRRGLEACKNRLI